MTLAAATADSIEQALAVLRRGGVVAFPTDTLYALGADATNDAAVIRVFVVKDRPGTSPLPLFVSDLQMADAVAVFNDDARRLARVFWPGAVTIVVPKRKEFASLALAGGDTVALRVPDSAIALELVRGLGAPVTATSANPSGGLDPVSASEVRDRLGTAVDLIIDGGLCAVGRPSTVVDCSGTEVAIVREGAVSAADVRSALRS